MSWWNEQPLEALTVDQWEALCDGCAKCCLHKLEDAGTGKVYYTKIRCQFMNADSCQCECYDQRSERVPECIDLKKHEVSSLHWLPSTCAYRLRSEGKPLPDWHYLVSGDRNSVHRAGVSIRGRAISDEFVHPDGYDEHIVKWVE